MEIDFEGMGAYFNQSARTLRRWKNEKPTRFSVMLDEYDLYLAGQSGSNDAGAIVIAAVSLKGGVGKSTISDALGYYLGDAVIINLDLAQPAAAINACPTIDYMSRMDEISIDDLIAEAAKKYRFIILDTPGDVTEEVNIALKVLETKCVR